MDTILIILEHIFKFLAKIIFGILKIFAWLIDTLGFTHFSEDMEDPNKKTILEAADELKTVEQEEKGEHSAKW